MKNFKSSVLLRRITALEKAVETRSWAGAQPPEDRDALDRKYQKARLALISYVMEYALPDEDLIQQAYDKGKADALKPDPKACPHCGSYSIRCGCD